MPTRIGLGYVEGGSEVVMHIDIFIGASLQPMIYTMLKTTCLSSAD
ncbi:MAG: hypothetical protein HON07_08430 [Planctomycetaceae bacterium]|nr:hypothetical protein [Planctomycetaceae bacterium]